MEGNKRIAYLLDRYLKNTCTPEEKNELVKLLSTNAYDEQVKSFMDKAWDRLPYDHTISESQSQRILASILLENNGRVVSMNNNSSSRKISWLVAASVLLLVAGAVTFLAIKKPSSSIPVAANEQKKAAPVKNDVAPGMNGAVLTLADGSQIVLDNAADGSLAQQGNATIVKKGGMLNYIDAGKSDAEVSYNTVATPRGRQFQLVLEDGTKVWLNAGSSIKFPAVFKEKTRDVVVTGEVYFEVAKNAAKPFRVDAKGMNVEVLGTHFNVNAYDDEASINTTLLEGSVKVIKGDKQKLLAPGQQAQMNGLGEFSLVKNINTEEVMAWKNNFFSFNNTDMNKLLRQLSRWYDVEVELKGAVQPVTFNGSISRNVNLSTVLKMLESTGEVKFSIEGKKVLVTM
jgi:ferric-dicitrate binding protein FerR (iron transport regulator)